MTHSRSPVRRQIRMLAGDAGRPVISSGTLKAVAIPLPTPAEQALLADTLDMTTTKLSKKAQQALVLG